MSVIQVNGLTFGYEGSVTPVFENASFSIDTDWKLGFIGRNGRGKTTFLRLLMGEYAFSGTITASVGFEYFPYPVAEPARRALDVARESVAPFAELERAMEAALAAGELDAYAAAQETYTAADGYMIDELLAREAGKLGLDAAVLERPFQQLSGGEKTKLLVAALFLKKNRFLLIDEPTNHLDAGGRALLAGYLASKKGFILVSHDRTFLDASVDHVLSIGRGTIEVQRGNFSTWQENRRLRDAFELERNSRLKKDIGRLKETAREKAGWSDQIESTKIGTHSADRGAIGHKAAKMMKRAKAIEKRSERAVAEKEELLKDIEQEDALKLHPLTYHSQRLVQCSDLVVDYGAGPLFAPLTFSVERGERIALCGPNGCGKSSVLKALCADAVPFSGTVQRGGGLHLSIVGQDASGVRGTLGEFAERQGVEYSLFLTILRKLGFERRQFERRLEEFSEGQKKKALLASSLASEAHLYIWDEPLNFIDVISRMQIERLLLNYRPTMVFVEHDAAFVSNIASRTIQL